MGVLLGCCSCEERLDESGCEQLLSRYVELLMRREAPDLSRAELDALRERALGLAREQPRFDFASCTRELDQGHLSCALEAQDVDRLEQCMIL